MNTLKRLLASIVVTVILTVSLTYVAYAATQYINEQDTSHFIKGGSGTLSSISCSGCIGGKTKKTTLSGSTTSYTVSGKWKSYDSTPDSIPYYWYVYIPNEQAGNYAAVQYFVTDGSDDNFYVNVFQSNHKGQWVYLGWVYGIGGVSYTYMTNRCIPGALCINSSSLPVYYDHAKYTY